MSVKKESETGRGSRATHASIFLRSLFSALELLEGYQSASARERKSGQHAEKEKQEWRRTEAVLNNAPRGPSEAGESAGRSLYDGEERMDALGLVTVRRGKSSRQHSASGRSDGKAPTSDRSPRQPSGNS